MNNYKILTTCGYAKRAELTTPHGVIQTPVFMNVATVAAIKGGLDAEDLKRLGCQIALANTYHLHVRPGDSLIYDMGGLHKFMAWDAPILTDSGGFQIFSLSPKMDEEGCTFRSHIDGRRIFIGPEESMTIQSHLGATICMAFDECAPIDATRDYIQHSVERTTRWLRRCVIRLTELNGYESSINHSQMLFGINQGALFTDIRRQHAKEITELDLPGYAIGGLAVGETHAQMYQMLDDIVPYLPQDKPTYLMGVGTPENILEAVERGVDFFDCVLPARNGRHAHVFTHAGKINLRNKQYERDDGPIDQECGCPVCQRHSRSYLRHLFAAREMLALRLCVMHNLYFYNNLMVEIRAALEAGSFAAYKRAALDRLGRAAMP
ncbi:MAG: tRNA guanosine(34) transglycosylase Tgt [Clostridiales bacterium]|jgi:queuine tRNA-ribosyltransferase|nr:tRNA guanosine(34) transglycosylase Tgt [Clostridiales bacterium]